MLESLHVKNLALIKESEVFFYLGLNILSGETGAGKSIILGSIRLALGAKAGKDFIRNGEEYALIELIFKSTKSQITEKLNEFDLPVEEDGTVFIQRKIKSRPHSFVFRQKTPVDTGAIEKTLDLPAEIVVAYRAAQNTVNAEGAASQSRRYALATGGERVIQSVSQ